MRQCQTKAKTASEPKYEPVLKLPPLPTDQYEALRANIAVHGVLVPILVDSDGPRRKIIDGNYRKQISVELGYECPEIVQPGLDDDEKRVLARCLNLARRQLNTEQKREVIADQLRETPNWTNRRIGKMLGVSHPFVASVRAELESVGNGFQQDRRVGSDGKEYKSTKAKDYWGERRAGVIRNADNPLDFHPTPEHVTEALLARERFQGLILEPASGDGAIIRVFRRAGYTVTGTDIVTGTDFLKTTEAGGEHRHESALCGRHGGEVLPSRPAMCQGQGGNAGADVVSRRRAAARPFFNTTDQSDLHFFPPSKVR